MIFREVAERLTFHQMRRVQCQGQPAIHWTASAPGVFTRKPKRDAPDGKHMAPIPGAPLALRLGVSRLCDTRLAEWYWLSTLPETVSDAQIALRYDFRWPIESFFKRLK